MHKAQSKNTIDLTVLTKHKCGYLLVTESVHGEFYRRTQKTGCILAMKNNNSTSNSSLKSSTAIPYYKMIRYGVNVEKGGGGG